MAISQQQEALLRAFQQLEPEGAADGARPEQFPVRSTEELSLPSRSGSTHAFLHLPPAGAPPYPLLVNIHGGGFVRGHRAQDSVFCRDVAGRSGYAVLDLDYTPVPQQRFPYALHQCYDAVVWAAREANALGVDASRIALCGHSAGGNFAVGTALLAGLHETVPLRLLLLDYPCLDLQTSPFQKRNAYGAPRRLPEALRPFWQSAYPDADHTLDPTLAPRMAQLYTDAYVDERDRLDPLVSPVFAPKEMLAKLPPTVLLVCDNYLLRDEALLFAARLLEAGVPVSARNFLQSGHGFTMRRTGEYRAATETILLALEHALRR